MIQKAYDEKVQKWIEDNREKVLKIWMDLVRIPSVQGESKPGAPFGENCARAMENAVARFREAGFDARAVEGTYGVCEAVATVKQNGGTSIIGGGDSVSAVKKSGKAAEMSHISTGGGASLEFLEGKTLPGVAALADK